MSSIQFEASRERDVGSVIQNAAIVIARSGAVARSNAARAVEFAAQVELRVTGRQGDMIWSGVGADVRFLEARGLPALSAQPLWLVDVREDRRYQSNFPLWIRKPFDEFAASELGQSPGWKIWINWYRSILPNARSAAPQSLFGEENDISIARKGPAFWTRVPESVGAEIIRLTQVTRKPREEYRNWVEFEEVDDLPNWDAQQEKAAETLSEQREPAPKVEHVEPQSDEPTLIDQLGRRAFAQALVERMDKIHSKGGRDGFAAHIHAPWGAGKTSVLLMMRDLMTAENRKAGGEGIGPLWVIVDFNAWEQQRRNPPWWPLIEAVKGSCLERLSGAKGGVAFLRAFMMDWWLKGYQVDLQPLWLQARWSWWRMKTDALPYVVFASVTLACFWFLWFSSDRTDSSSEWILKILTAALAVCTAVFGATRVAVFGSSTNAKFYDDISKDPLDGITRLFRRIIEKTNAPVCIFVDDLDRCRSDYVVDLLEGIQTSFRQRHVAYVVAADRNWIKASFENRYTSFSTAVGNAGQPLGYLFLEKIFQVSTPVPGMGSELRNEYWKGMLEDARSFGSSAATMQFDRNVERRRAVLRSRHGENLTHKKAEEILRESDTAEDRAAVVLELSSSAASEIEAEHLLAQFVDILPDNPRVMKRIVNAFSMRQAIGILERSVVPSDILARWTVLEQRLPALADLLIEHPEWVRHLSEKITEGEKPNLPSALLPFMELTIVREIIGQSEETSLTPDRVRLITRGGAT